MHMAAAIVFAWLLQLRVIERYACNGTTISSIVIASTTTTATATCTVTARWAAATTLLLTL
jgi:hypothetical protein